jgi:hypothetical protein
MSKSEFEKVEYWHRNIEAGLKARTEAAAKYEWEKIKKLWNEGGMDVQVVTSSLNQRTSEPVKSAFVNWIYAYISTFIPAVYWRQPKVFVTPVRSMYSLAANIAEAKTNYALQVTKSRKWCTKTILDCLVYGIGWIKVGWYTRFGQVPQSPAATGLDIEESELDTEAYFFTDEPYSYRVSPERIVVDPEAQIYEEARWIAQEHYYPYESLKKDPYMKNTENIALYTMRDKDRDILKPASEAEEEDWVRVWEIWDREHDRVMFMCDGSDKMNRIIKQWPYQISGFPFEPLTLTDTVDSFYPPSVILPWLGLVEELAYIRTTRLDHLSRMVTKYVARTGAMTPDQIHNFLDHDNELVEIDDPENLKEFKGLAPDAQLYQAEERVTQDIREISGFSELLSGSVPFSRVSATTSAIMQKNSALRFNFASERVAEFIKSFAQKLLLITKDFQQYPDSIKVTSNPNEPPIEYGRKDIEGEYMFTINVEDMSFVSREQKQKQEYDALVAMAQYPQIRIHPMLRDALAAFGKDPVEEYLNPEQGPPLDPQFENEMMIKGVPVQPNPQEDFQTHLMVHDQFMKTPIYMQAIRAIPQVGALFTEHVQMTLGMFEQAQAQMPRPSGGPQPGFSTSLQQGTALASSSPQGGPRNMRGPAGNPLMQSMGGAIQ